MISTAAHEHYVARRFDDRQGTFREEIRPGDARVSALIRALGDLRGRAILDLGCGKGRFSRHLTDRGATAFGLDLSAAMLDSAGHLAGRVRGSVRHLPFADHAFDAVFAVEVLQHVADRAIDGAIDEALRVLRPGGRLAIIDRNAGALNDRRPWIPAALVKRRDERRGRWMYEADGPVRERWFRPGRLARRIARRFESVEITYLLGDEEAKSPLFRALPRARSFVLWAATAPGGPR